MPLESESDRRLLAAFDFRGAGISLAIFQADLSSGVARVSHDVLIHQDSSLPDSAVRLANFSEILRYLTDESPDACLILHDGILPSLLALAADLLGISVFSLVTTPEQLANMPRRGKPRPDLFFLADAALFPLALHDPRYGSTVLPTGHPLKDLREPAPTGADDACCAPRFGDGQAAARILAAIQRWRRAELEPAQPELAIIVPAYKESGNLELVCTRLLDVLEESRIPAEILLIDDGSPDDTYEVAVRQLWRSPRIRAFTKSPPRGMGNAIIYGLRHTRAPVVAITMGDGSDDVARIPEMFRLARDEGYSLVIGSRYRHRENYANVPRLYRFWSRCFRLTSRWLIGFALTDYTNAFRLFHRRILAHHPPESGGFEISPEITFRAWFATRRVAEVDVRHLKRASGQSNFSFLRAGPGYARILLKALINRLTGRWLTLGWYLNIDQQPEKKDRT